MIEWLDETCGDLMAQLEHKGVDHNTLVLYLADNGWNENGKGSPYENGVRTPVIARWPAVIKARRDREHLASNLDVVPTILSATGIRPPVSLPGIDLLDEKAVADRDAIFLSNFAFRMVSPTRPEKSLWTRTCIREQWKLLVWEDDIPRKARGYNGGSRRKNRGVSLELFDLSSDPHETTNLAAKRPEVVEDLRARTNAWWDPRREL